MRIAALNLLDRLAKDRLILFLILVLMNACWSPYGGLMHDARLYALQITDRLEVGHFANDLYLQFGSQDRYSIFSSVVTPIARLWGIETTFFVLYMVCNALFLWSLMQLVFALVQSRIAAVVALLYLAVTPIAFGGLCIFHVNENFFTPRIISNTLVLLACERLIHRRFGVALLCLAGALLFHPIMAFCGLLVWLGAVAIERLPIRRIAWITGLMSIAVAGILLNPTVGIPIFGKMDANWLSIVHDSNFYAFPTEWLAVDWLWIGIAFGVASATCFSDQVPKPIRRIVGLIASVAAIGILFGMLAPQLPFALLFQGQPYRALWLLQLLAVPLGFMLIEERWKRSGMANQWGVISLTALFAFKSFTLWILMMELFVAIMVCLWLTRRPWTARLLLTVALGSWIVVTAGSLVGWGVALSSTFANTHEYAYLIVWQKLPRTILGPGLVCGLSLLLLYGLWRLSDSRRLFSAVLIGLIISWIIPWYSFHGRPHSESQTMARGGEIEFVKSYLQSQIATNFSTTQRTPTLHWPLCDPKELWFELHANCYFSWVQLSGNMFNRQTAMEGERRARLVRTFDKSVYRNRKLFAAPWQQRSFRRLYGNTLDLAEPSAGDLLRLCQEDSLDYVVLRQDLGGMFDATDGKLYIYDCKKIYQLLAAGD